MQLTHFLLFVAVKTLKNVFCLLVYAVCFSSRTHRLVILSIAHGKENEDEKKTQNQRLISALSGSCCNCFPQFRSWHKKQQHKACKDNNQNMKKTSWKIKSFQIGSGILVLSHEIENISIRNCEIERRFFFGFGWIITWSKQSFYRWALKGENKFGINFFECWKNVKNIWRQKKLLLISNKHKKSARKFELFAEISFCCKNCT